MTGVTWGGCCSHVQAAFAVLPSLLLATQPCWHDDGRTIPNSLMKFGRQFSFVSVKYGSKCNGRQSSYSPAMIGFVVCLSCRWHFVFGAIIEISSVDRCTDPLLFGWTTRTWNRSLCSYAYATSNRSHRATCFSVGDVITSFDCSII